MSDAHALSRRRFLQTAAAASAATAAVGTLGARAAGAGPLDLLPPPPTTELQPSDDAVRHVLNRITWGPTRTLLTKVKTIGIEAYIDEQLSPALIPDETCDSYLEVFITLQQSSAEMVSKYKTSYLADRIIAEVRGATLVRAIWSERQVHEVMVDFWSNHFNVLPHNNSRYLKTESDRESIRPYALGRFADILRASAHDPMMLVYLDNWKSSKVSPNENYGREVLELHTVGTSAFTEEDMKNAVLALTGMSYDFNTLKFQYKPDLHYTGPLRVMDWTNANLLAATGESVANSLLDYLARHPATARRLAYKLCLRFVSDTPSDALVTSTAQVYLDNDTDIRPVLRHILTSDEFLASPGKKLRRPVEVVAAHIRNVEGTYAKEGGTKGADNALLSLAKLQQLPFDWWQPDGYPDIATAWSTTGGAIYRWDFAQLMCLKGIVGIWIPDHNKLLPTPRPQTAGAIVDALTDRLAGVRFDDRTRNAVIGYLGVGENGIVTDDTFWWQLPQLVALVLSSPYLQNR